MLQKTVFKFRPDGPLGSYADFHYGRERSDIDKLGNCYVEDSYTSLSVPCPAGHFCSLFSSKPLPCEAGTYRQQSSNVTHKCIPCSKTLALQGGRKTGAMSVSDCFTGEACICFFVITSVHNC